MCCSAGVIQLRVVLLSFILLGVILLIVVITSAIYPSIVHLNVDRLSLFPMTVFPPNDILSSVIWLTVVSPISKRLPAYPPAIQKFQNWDKKNLSTTSPFYLTKNVLTRPSRNKLDHLFKADFSALK
jgi:hypothetical protein